MENVSRRVQKQYFRMEKEYWNSAPFNSEFYDIVADYDPAESLRNIITRMAGSDDDAEALILDRMFTDLKKGEFHGEIADALESVLNKLADKYV